MKKRWLLIVACCILLSLTGCSSKDDIKSGEKISIATGATSEWAIMAYMVRYMIEHYTDEEVEMINNLGTSLTLHQAMINHDANISSARYTATELMGALGEEPIKDPEKAFIKTRDLLDERFDQKYFESYGFENTYAFMVTEENAKKYDLKTISDLKKIAGDIQVGIDTSWMNRVGDGYKEFSKEYGFKFKKVYPMQIGLVYDALQADKMDVVLGYTTDGRISSYNLVLLEDDLNFFPSYEGSALASNAVLEKHPEIEKALQKLVGKISTEKMQQLNYQADNDLVEPSIVAKRFLEENNYFEGDDE